MIFRVAIILCEINSKKIPKANLIRKKNYSIFGPHQVRSCSQNF